MQVPLEVTFRDVVKTPEIEQLIMRRAEKLDKICDYMTSCRVMVERPLKSRHSARPYHVRLDITVPPGHEIAISRDPARSDEHLDLGAEIRWAFEAAERELKELMERQRRDVKTHHYQQVQGVIARLLPEQDSGFIRTLDNREIYFHRNSVLHDSYDQLRPGTGVRFTEEMGDEGPQASSVQIVDNPESY